MKTVSCINYFAQKHFIRLTRMLSLDLADVVLMKGSAKEKLKFWIVPLLLLSHLLKLGAVPGYKLSQLHNDVAKL